MRCVKLSATREGPVTANFENSLNYNGEFFRNSMKNLGIKILDVINIKARELGDPNFSLFTTDVLQSFLGPSMAMYYVSRSVQQRARKQVIHHFIPYIFTTQKTSYQIAALWKLEFEQVAPDSVLDFLFSLYGYFINISGRSDFGSVEEDEALEMTVVRGTKEGDSTGTLAALRTIFLVRSSFFEQRRSYMKNSVHWEIMKRRMNKCSPR